MQVPTSEIQIGQVKWFNTKTGFGFLTVMSEGEYQTKDIFVHHSDLTVPEDQYRYLVMGEYVQFTMMETDDEHKVKASNVTGMLGARLMCQVRNENQRSNGDRRSSRPRNSSRTEQVATA
tara:strand:+ start:3826 stop:4185 length:360 start_codon:yes stop_codon:yes gene_type:complete